MKTLQQIESKAYASGFNHYSDFAHPDKVEYPRINIFTLTCTEGEHNGDVVDVWYNYDTGEIKHVSIYSQFPNTKPTFSI